ncbi:GNAT family N-acetyltransferase [Phycicoccus ginsengisoli]
MTADATPGPDVVLGTERLLLRPWRPDEASVLRELWTERDGRVPLHRRIDAEGRPTLQELEHAIQAEPRWKAGLLAVERRSDRDVIGCCGLVDSDRGTPGEPEIAFELLRRAQGHGYATEASSAVLRRAKAVGHQRIWATVWDWNAPSRRVLAKLGFTETGSTEVDPVHGTTLVLVRPL